MAQIRLEERLRDVIKTDATNSERADFLATHLPIRNLEYILRGKDPQVMDEGKFLQREILGNKDQHQLIIVQGENGSGKSHFIRWLKERYVSSTDPNQEAVLLIAKAQSTLRGALEQIVNSGLFPQTNQTQEMQQLVKANEHLDDEALKNNILMQFALLAKQDKAEDLLPSRWRRYVFDFLVDKTVMNHFLRAQGPIERIKARLNPDDKLKRQDEVDPDFLPEDFHLDFRSQISQIKHEGSRGAVRLAEALADSVEGPPLRRQVAHYLNKKMDQVIQATTNLRATDLQSVFEQLRRELKKQGKRLTLFIEDITSFRGIDSGLVDALVTEHTGGDFNHEFCRLISVVGITNGYYVSHFPNHLKDRVSGRILMDKATLQTEQETAEMAARYLNAIYSSPEVLNEWVRHGAADENLPLAEQNREQAWALFTLPDGRQLSLFPFNVKALWNIYNHLRDQKTPRTFLWAMTSVFQYYTSAPAEFPPSPTDFTFDLPDWQERRHEQALQQRARPHADRLSSLLRLWGDGTAEYRKVGETETVGGLTKELFASFGLPYITTISTGASGTSLAPNRNPNPSPTPTPDRDRDYNAQPGNDQPFAGQGMGQGVRGKAQGVGSDTGLGSGRGETTEGTSEGRSSPPPQVAKDPKREAFDTFAKELDKWSTGEKLHAYRQLRTDLYTLFVNAIDWQSEGIPASLIQAYFKDSKIAIKGQIGDQRGSILTFERSAENKYAFLALGAWRHLGEKSWHFEGAVDYLNTINQWLLRKKAQVLKAVRQAGTQVDTQWFDPQWSFLADFYAQAVSGQLQPVEEKEQLYQAFFQPLALDDLPQPGRSDAWSTVQNDLRKSRVHLVEHHDFVRRYFNAVQGEISHTTEVCFIDAVEVLKIMDALEALEWNVSKLKLPEVDQRRIDERRLSSLALLNLFQAVCATALAGEQQKAQNLLDEVVRQLGQAPTEQEIRKVFADMLTFLKETLPSVHEGFRHELFAGLVEETLTPEDYLNSCRAVELVDGNKAWGKALPAFSAHPNLRLEPYIRLLQAMDALLEEKQKQYAVKQANLRKENHDIPQIRTKINDLLKTLLTGFQDLAK